MWTTRRQFITRSALGGFGLMAAPLVPSGPAFAGIISTSRSPEPKERQIRAWESRYYRAFGSNTLAQDNAAAWVQIDLGTSHTIDAITFQPSQHHSASRNNSLAEFCIECCDDPSFDVNGRPDNCRVSGHMEEKDLTANVQMQGRYLRLAAIRPQRQVQRDINKGVPEVKSLHTLGITKVKIFSENTILSVLIDKTPNFYVPFRG